MIRSPCGLLTLAVQKVYKVTLMGFGRMILQFGKTIFIAVGIVLIGIMEETKPTSA